LSMSGRRRYKGEKAGTKACLHRRRSGTSWLGPAKPLSWRKSAKTGARRTRASLTGGSAGSAAPAPRSPTARGLLAAGRYHRAARQEPPSAAGRRAAPARAREPGRCPWRGVGPAHRPWAASVPAAVDERQVAHELPEGLLDTVRTRHKPLLGFMSGAGLLTRTAAAILAHTLRLLQLV
jgi:hypothetical protein